MAQDVNSPNFTIGVIGTGTMGRGIAQISVTGGFRVKMFDAQEGAAEKAQEFIHRMVSRAAEKGQMSEAGCHGGEWPVADRRLARRDGGLRDGDRSDCRES